MRTSIQSAPQLLTDELLMIPRRESRIALVTVADQITYRRIAALLDPGTVEVTAMTAPPLTLEAAAEICRELNRPPDIVLLSGGKELFCPAGGVELVRTLLPESRIVVITSRQDRDFVRRALRAGVRGIVADTDAERTLAAILRCVRAGQVCVPRSITARIDTSAFSQRESEVLEMVTRGLTNSQIASGLFLSESTVKSHLASSFRKLGLSSRAEAAALWSEVLAEAEEASVPQLSHRVPMATPGQLATVAARCIREMRPPEAARRLAVAV